jgi:hypothetical protein
MLEAGEYWVEVCASCHHPGGLHIAYPPEKIRCRCCADCPGYVDGDYAVWSDERTREARAAEEVS